MAEQLRRARPGEPSASLLAIAVDRVGKLKGARVLAFMVAWEQARRALGEEWPTGPGEGIEAQVRAYSGWWRQSERTGWNELARFREAFPGESTPARLMELARDDWDERRGVAGLGAVELAAA